MSHAQHQSGLKEVFIEEREENIVLLRFAENRLFHATDIGAKEKLISSLDRISKDNRIRAIVLLSSPDKTGKEEYLVFYHAPSNGIHTCKFSSRNFGYIPKASFP